MNTTLREVFEHWGACSPRQRHSGARWVMSAATWEQVSALPLSSGAPAGFELPEDWPGLRSPTDCRRYLLDLPVTLDENAESVRIEVDGVSVVPLR